MKRIFYLNFCILCLTTQYASAQFWKSVGNTITGGLKAVTQVATAPTQVVINAAKAPFTPSSYYQPVVQLAQTTNQTVVNGINVVNAPQTFLVQQATQAAGNIAGKPGEFVIDLGTFMQQYSNNLALSGAQVSNNILNGQNPFQIVGAPLAASIHAARDRFINSSSPIPADVKQALAPYFDQNTLDRARYAIGSVEIALPNLISQGRKLFGDGDWAVTVDDIMVFPRDPGSYQQSCQWWAHELTHVQQYAKWGVEQFAYNYVKGYHSVEDEAINNANTITNYGNCGGTNQYTQVQADIINRQVSYNAATASVQTTSPVGYVPSLLYQNEYYTAQCILPNNPLGAMFLITNMGRIIAVNPSNGQSMHVGFANPPRLGNVAWSFDMPAQDWKFAVGFDGRIYFPTGPLLNYLGQVVGYQNWQPIGYVQAL